MNTKKKQTDNVTDSDSLIVMVHVYTCTCTIIYKFIAPFTYMYVFTLRGLDGCGRF